MLAATAPTLKATPALSARHSAAAVQSSSTAASDAQAEPRRRPPAAMSSRLPRPVPAKAPSLVAVAAKRSAKPPSTTTASSSTETDTRALRLDVRARVHCRTRVLHAAVHAWAQWARVRVELKRRFAQWQHSHSSLTPGLQAALHRWLRRLRHWRRLLECAAVDFKADDDGVDDDSDESSLLRILYQRKLRERRHRLNTALHRWQLALAARRRLRTQRQCARWLLRRRLVQGQWTRWRHLYRGRVVLQCMLDRARRIDVMRVGAWAMRRWLGSVRERRRVGWMEGTCAIYVYVYCIVKW